MPRLSVSPPATRKRRPGEAGAPNAGATVIGISPDKPAAQGKFDTKYGLGFSLLSDPDNAVADAYGAWGERSMYGKKYMGIVRSAFVIDGRAPLPRRSTR